jgi:exonuclease III
MKFDVLRSVPTAIAGKQRMWVYCRIDYHLATPALANGARKVDIYKGEKFSDHAPITIEYDFKP